MINLLVGNTVTTVDGYIPPEAYQALRKNVGYVPENAEHMAKRMGFEWDRIISTLCYKGKCRCAIKKDRTHFPSGLLARACEALDAHKVPYHRVDQRVIQPFSDCYTFASTKPLRPYQEDVVATAMKRGRGIVKLATGGGKTLIAAAMIARMGVAPFIFYVPSQELLTQAYEEFSAMIRDMNGNPVPIGRVGGGHRDVQDITVMTVASAVRALDPNRFVDKKGKPKKKAPKLFLGDALEDAFAEPEGDLGVYRAQVRDLIGRCRGMICDETHHWAAETCQLVADHSVSCSYRYGFSATPWRDMGDDILIDACFGKMICNISASMLIDWGFLVPPTIYSVPVTNMKFTRFADYPEAYEMGVVHNEARNQLISKIAQKMEASGRRVLVLIKHIAHGDILEELIPSSVFLHGEHSAKHRNGHLELMRQRKAPITIASTIFDEGIDVRPLDCLILAGGGKSPTRALQRIGRVIRPFEIEGYIKKDAVVIDLMDDMDWMIDHFYERVGMYATEPRFIRKELVLDGLHND